MASLWPPRVAAWNAGRAYRTRIHTVNDRHALIFVLDRTTVCCCVDMQKFSQGAVLVECVGSGGPPWGLIPETKYVRTVVISERQIMFMVKLYPQKKRAKFSSDGGPWSNMCSGTTRVGHGQRASCDLPSAATTPKSPAQPSPAPRVYFMIRGESFRAFYALGFAFRL